MPTYRFPDAVKKGNIPFSHGRDYKPVLGLDRLEKKEAVKIKTANNIVQLLGASSALATTGKVKKTTQLAFWDKNHKTSIKVSKEPHNVLKHVSSKNICVKEPLGSSGARWGPKLPKEDQMSKKLNIAERSFRNVVKRHKNDAESTTEVLGQTLPDYLEAKDIDSYFPAKREVKRLRRIVSHEILSKQGKRVSMRRSNRLDWHKIEMGIASRTIHAGIGW